MSSIVDRLLGRDDGQEVDAGHPAAVAIIPQSPSFHAVEQLDEDLLEDAEIVRVDDALAELGPCRHCYHTGKVAGQTAVVNGD